MLDASPMHAVDAAAPSDGVIPVAIGPTATGPTATGPVATGPTAIPEDGGIRSGGEAAGLDPSFVKARDDHEQYKDPSIVQSSPDSSTILSFHPGDTVRKISTRPGEALLFEVPEGDEEIGFVRVVGGKGTVFSIDRSSREKGFAIDPISGTLSFKSMGDVDLSGNTGWPVHILFGPEKNTALTVRIRIDDTNQAPVFPEGSHAFHPVLPPQSRQSDPDAANDPDHDAHIIWASPSQIGQLRARDPEGRSVHYQFYDPSDRARAHQFGIILERDGLLRAGHDKLPETRQEFTLRFVAVDEKGQRSAPLSLPFAMVAGQSNEKRYNILAKNPLPSTSLSVLPVASDDLVMAGSPNSPQRNSAGGSQEADSGDPVDTIGVGNPPGVDNPLGYNKIHRIPPGLTADEAASRAYSLSLDTGATGIEPGPDGKWRIDHTIGTIGILRARGISDNLSSVRFGFVDPPGPDGFSIDAISGALRFHPGNVRPLPRDIVFSVYAGGDKKARLVLPIHIQIEQDARSVIQDMPRPGGIASGAVHRPPNPDDPDEKEREPSDNGPTNPAVDPLKTSPGVNGNNRPQERMTIRPGRPFIRDNRSPTEDRVKAGIGASPLGVVNGVVNGDDEGGVPVDSSLNTVKKDATVDKVAKTYANDDGSDADEGGGPPADDRSADDAEDKVMDDDARVVPVVPPPNPIDPNRGQGNTPAPDDMNAPDDMKAPDDTNTNGPGDADTKGDQRDDGGDADEGGGPPADDRSADDTEDKVMDDDARVVPVVPPPNPIDPNRGRGNTPVSDDMNAPDDTNTNGPGDADPKGDQRDDAGDADEGGGAPADDRSAEDAEDKVMDNDARVVPVVPPPNPIDPNRGRGNTPVSDDMNAPDDTNTNGPGDADTKGDQRDDGGDADEGGGPSLRDRPIRRDAVIPVGDDGRGGDGRVVPVVPPPNPIDPNGGTADIPVPKDVHAHGHDRGHGNVADGGRHHIPRPMPPRGYGVPSAGYDRDRDGWLPGRHAYGVTGALFRPLSDSDEEREEEITDHEGQGPAGKLSKADSKGLLRARDDGLLPMRDKRTRANITDVSMDADGTIKATIDLDPGETHLFVRPLLARIHHRVGVSLDSSADIDVLSDTPDWLHYHALDGTLIADAPGRNGASLMSFTVTRGGEGVHHVILALSHGPALSHGDFPSISEDTPDDIPGDTIASVDHPDAMTIASVGADGDVGPFSAER